MSTLLSVNFDDVPDLGLLENGDYHFSVESAELTVSKAGKDMIKLVLVPVDEPNASAIMEYFVLPTPEDDERAKNRRLRRVKEFVRAFSVPNDKDVSTWAGSHGWALVTTEADETYGDKNRIVRYVIAGSGGTAFSNDAPAIKKDAVPF